MCDLISKSWNVWKPLGNFIKQESGKSEEPSRSSSGKRMYTDLGQFFSRFWVNAFIAQIVEAIRNSIKQWKKISNWNGPQFTEHMEHEYPLGVAKLVLGFTHGKRVANTSPFFCQERKIFEDDAFIGMFIARGFIIHCFRILMVRLKSTPNSKIIWKRGKTFPVWSGLHCASKPLHLGRQSYHKFLRFGSSPWERFL